MKLIKYWKKTRSCSPKIIFKFIVELEGTEKPFRWVVQRFRWKYEKYDTNKCDFVVKNEISLTVNKFHQPLLFLLTVNIFINGK